jgi:hypothetical protein
MRQGPFDRLRRVGFHLEGSFIKLTLVFRIRQPGKNFLDRTIDFQVCGKFQHGQPSGVSIFFFRTNLVVADLAARSHHVQAIQIGDNALLFVKWFLCFSFHTYIKQPLDASTS